MVYIVSTVEVKCEELQMRLFKFGILSIFLLVFVSGCNKRSRSPELSTSSSHKSRTIKILELTSSAFVDGSDIPTKFTCDGEDVSPELKWNDPPKGTAAYALICDDPDAPGDIWVHWVIYDIPVDARSLPEAFDSAPELPYGAIQGRNDFKRIGYGGPCPPPSKRHRYFFKLYALDAPTGLAVGATKKDLMKAMKGHILGRGQLMGTYQR